MIPWVEVVQTTLMRYELHVGFYFRLSIHNEDHIVAPIGDTLLETQFSQVYYIGDGVFN